MDSELADLVWRGVEDANPWWKTGAVPPERTSPFRRHAFETIYAAVKASERGRGVLVLGPRRIGKTIIMHQLAEQLMVDGVTADEICALTLDDVALRNVDLGQLLELVQQRKPLPAGAVRMLLLDEVQHSPDWSGWLKRVADRREPL